MVNLSWYNIEDYVEKIVLEVKQYELDTIIGISRGGMIPAIMMSHKLGVKNVSMIIVDSYDKNNIKVKKIKISPLYGSAIGNLLIIDDVNDTGDTLCKVLKMFYNHEGIIKTAVLVHKIGSSFSTNIYGLVCNDWVKFPWEV